MAGLKVFISSTCYDLSILRSSLRTFIKSLGYEPVMSDYDDVVYDPRQHTHTSCINEVSNCDILVVIIGSRYGGTVVPEALNVIDSSNLEELMKKTDEKLSITQLEVIEAIQNKIPVYTFIDKKVYHEHELYEKNKKSAKDIIFPAIEKQETATYIFEFINFLRLKSAGNFIFAFEKMQDIEGVLKKQWSGYFQRLLNEQRHREEEHKQIDVLSEQFNDLKTALLSSIQNVDQRKVAKGITNFRRLLEFLISIKISKNAIIHNTCEFRELLKKHHFVDVCDERKIGLANGFFPPKLFLIKDDDTFFDCRIRMESFLDIENDWLSYKEEEKETKEIIYDTINEMYYPKGPIYRYRNESFRSYVDRINENSAELPNN